ncbi:MAG: dioxygenase, partial [Deltaproteobacteria bacterium]
MKDVTEHTLTDAVIRRLENCQNGRLGHVMTRLITHLHAFVREVEPSSEEWLAAIRFLTRTGQISDEQRQEFILLSDTLGVTMLIDTIQHRAPEGATESSVLGPFYVPGAPDRPAGANMALTPGPLLTVRGQVTSTAREPIAGALLDVWQAAATGLYDVQDATQPKYNLRARFRTDVRGRYEFQTIRPVSYPIPTDGPVGSLLAQLGCHPYRPAHVHFIVSAQGYKTVVTELFDRSDTYLDSDVVFGVKNSLAVEFAARPGAA